MKFVTFYLLDQKYGIDIKIIREVNPNLNITRVPMAGKEVRGLVNVRGQIVMVIDLNIIFGREPLAVKEESQLLILKTVQEVRQIHNLTLDFAPELLGDHPVAFLIDKTGDVLNVNPSVIEQPPPHIKEFTNGIIHLNEELLIILNPGELLAV